jgi:hypothetical protein
MHPEVKIIYISGYGVTTRLQGGVLDEEAVLVQKPVTPDELLAIVKDTLGSQSPETRPTQSPGSSDRG